jgi:hypothetical protein
MRWPYVDWAWDGSGSNLNQSEYDFYAKPQEPRKILVTNPENGKSIIAAALEAGPGPWTGTGVPNSGVDSPQKQLWGAPRKDTPAGYTGRVAGLPQTAMDALGATNWVNNGPSAGGSGTKLQFSWASDQSAKPGPTNSQPNAPTSTERQSGKLYLIGDSITQDTGVNQQLVSQLKALGYNDVITNSLASRRLSEGGGGDAKDGITAFLFDKDKWKDASTIVIELGTNGGINKENIQKMLFAIKESNPNAKVYWVNVGANNATRDAGDINTDEIDRILKENTALGYKVIDWNSVVKQKPDLIFDDGLGVHPYTDAGRVAYVDTVVKGLGATGETPSALSGECACKSGSGTNLSGNDNKEKIYNFLISKGLTPNQAAGIMGNLQAESGFEPRLVEYGWKNSRGEVSRAGQPSSLDDDIPPNQNSKGQPGFGLVQWTSPGRKDGLRKRSQEQNKKPSDLQLQLEYFFYELFESDGYKKWGDQIKSQDSLESTADIMLRRYEIPAEIDFQLPIRIGFAQKILQEFGGTTPVAGSVSVDSDCLSSSLGGGNITQIAEREFLAGANEQNGGYKKYSDGADEPWCADFVSWVLKEAGTPFTGGVSGGWRIPGVDSVQAYFQQNNAYNAARTGYVPKPGDIVIFNEGVGPYPSHVNIVISVEGKKITTIGGNESNQIKKAVQEDYDGPGITGFGTPGVKK